MASYGTFVVWDGGGPGCIKIFIETVWDGGGPGCIKIFIETVSMATICHVFEMQAEASRS